MTMEASSVRRILLINLAYIGDVVLSTPLARALQQAYPAAELDMLVIPAASAVAAGNPYVSHVMVYDKRGAHRRPTALWKLIVALRRQKYDLAVTPNFSLRSAMMAWACGARWRAGFDAQHASWLLTHAASSKRSEIRHETENQLAVLRPLGITTENTLLEYKLDEHDRRSLQDKVKRNSGRPRIVICPFGRQRLKSWPLEKYAALLPALAAQADCYLIGGTAEREGLDAIQALAGCRVEVLAGVLTLGELAVLLAEADLMVTVDTGPMHIAAAVGTPIVALFGRTDFRVWGPQGPKAVIVKADVSCRPCVDREECLHHRCMTELSVDEVLAASLQLLERQKRLPAVFFDRDGVLNYDEGYTHSPEQFRWMAGAIDTIRAFHDCGWLVFVVTNQSGIGRNYYSRQDVENLHQWMNQELQKQGAHIDAFFYCPHHPEAALPEYRQTCSCRKPMPGMILQALAEWPVDKDKSILIGDRAGDVEAARRAGIAGYLFQEENLYEYCKKNGLIGKSLVE